MLNIFYISFFLSVLFFASFFFCCLSIFLHPKKTIFVESACMLLFPCVSSHWWLHFPRSVLINSVILNLLCVWILFQDCPQTSSLMILMHSVVCSRSSALELHRCIGGRTVRSSLYRARTVRSSLHKGAELSVLLCIRGQSWFWFWSHLLQNTIT